MASSTKLDRNVTYLTVDMTPKDVAEYVKAHPYHSRDYDLAEGWLVAMKVGGPRVVKALQNFLDGDFLVENNNGVPGWHVRKISRTDRLRQRVTRTAVQ